ncbi:MAG: hypothetical protein HY904_10080 [Deltaproteobacteria bacterium]|nr:hypothetical protein [Deltaproteobacteria bacterium]
MSTCSALGYIANEPERVSCALHELKGTLKAPDNAAGFGLAHYVDDRLLLNLRPSPVAAGTTLEDLVGPVRTSTFLSNFHGADDGGPYKFRAWSFAMVGGGPESLRDELLRGLPDFLRRNMSGEHVSEAAFHRLLANLVEERHPLEDANLAPRVVGTALARLLDVFGALRVVVMVSNGRFIAGAHNGAGMSYNLREGILACQRCAMDRHALDSFPLRESHRRFRGVLLLGGQGTPPGFQAIPAGQALVANRKLEVTLL